MDSGSKIGILLILSTMLMVPSWLSAQQKILVLEKTMTQRSTRYSSGDDISFKLKGEKFYRTNHIIALNDSAIEFHYYSVNYNEIEKIFLKKRRLSGWSPVVIGTFAQIAGLGYIALDVINQGIKNDEGLSSDVFLIGGLIFAGGTALKLLEPRKVKIGGKYRLRYMYISTN